MSYFGSFTLFSLCMKAATTEGFSVYSHPNQYGQPHPHDLPPSYDHPVQSPKKDAILLNSLSEHGKKEKEEKNSSLKWGIVLLFIVSAASIGLAAFGLYSRKELQDKSASLELAIQDLSKRFDMAVSKFAEQRLNSIERGISSLQNNVNVQVTSTKNSDQRLNLAEQGIYNLQGNFSVAQSRSKVNEQRLNLVEQGLSSKPSINGIVNARFLSLKRISNSLDMSPRMINLATFAIWEDRSGFLTRITPGTALFSVSASELYTGDGVLYPKSNIIDDDSRTFYHSSTGRVNPQYITIDLGEERPIAAVMIASRQEWIPRMTGLQLQLADKSGSIIYANSRAFLGTNPQFNWIYFNSASDSAVHPLLANDSRAFLVARAKNGEPRYTLSKQEAIGVCAEYGADLATYADIAAAQSAGDQWCSWGWISDGYQAAFPMKYGADGCGGPGVSTWAVPAGDYRLAANCYGSPPLQVYVKAGDTIVYGFNG
jgi:hypothetical protein